MTCAITDCFAYWNPSKSYTEGVTLPVDTLSLTDVGNYSTLNPYVYDLGLSDNVPYTPSGHVTAGAVTLAPTFAEKTFTVSVLDYTDIEQPDDIYTGTVDKTALDSYSTEDAESANSTVLSFSPPVPPTLVYDIDLPSRPDLDLVFGDIPDDGTGVDIMAVMPALYTTIETAAMAIIDDVLKNLSTSIVTAFNTKIFDTDPAKVLSLAGIRTPSRDDIVTVETRQSGTMTRELAIIDGDANNTTVAAGVNLRLDQVKSGAHALYQTARLDDAKHSVEQALQNIVLSVITYNAEVQAANVQYMEFEKLVTIELKKLEEYEKLLGASLGVIDGNNDLVRQYQKQVSVVEQVFKSMEDAMKLSKYVLELLKLSVDVDTLNIKTNTMIIDGTIDNTENSTYQKKTANMASGMNDEASLAAASTNLIVDRGRIASEILSMTESIENANIDTENSILSASAEAVGVKVRAIQQMFDLENLSSYNNAVLADMASHSDNVRRKTAQDIKANTFYQKMNGSVSAENSKYNIWYGREQGYLSAWGGLEDYITYSQCAAEILAAANTEMTLNQEISG